MEHAQADKNAMRWATALIQSLKRSQAIANQMMSAIPIITAMSSTSASQELLGRTSQLSASLMLTASQPTTATSSTGASQAPQETSPMESVELMEAAQKATNAMNSSSASAVIETQRSSSSSESPLFSNFF